MMAEEDSKKDERISYLEERLETFPRYPLSVAPTPCHLLPFLKEAFGVEVYCKREDLSGFAFGGNKTRKLEFLLGEALAQGCDTLVTCGGIQSNFCRMAAAAGAVAGMDVYLILGGRAPERLTGNLLLDSLVGAEMIFVGTPVWSVWERESERLSERLIREGRKVFRIPMGGSVPVGVMGYVTVFLEILEEEKRLGLSFDRIIHASGSGGTQAGLLVGQGLCAWPGKIAGISVAMPREGLEEKVFDLARHTASLLGGRINRDSVFVDDGFVGAGYAVPTRGAREAIQYFATHGGLFLDHVYTGKAASALMAWLDEGRLAQERVLFIHTGGGPELFAETG